MTSAGRTPLPTLHGWWSWANSLTTIFNIPSMPNKNSIACSRVIWPSLSTAITWSASPMNSRTTAPPSLTQCSSSTPCKAWTSSASPSLSSPLSPHHRHFSMSNLTYHRRNIPFNYCIRWRCKWRSSKPPPPLSWTSLWQPHHLHRRHPPMVPMIATRSLRPMTGATSRTIPMARAVPLVVVSLHLTLVCHRHYWPWYTHYGMASSRCGPWTPTVPASSDLPASTSRTLWWLSWHH